MATEQERDLLKEFIEAYRNNPCLWDSTSDLYRNKEMKHKAWGLLTKILKRLDPDANICTTKKKVDNLRTCYYRELRKVRASKLLATDEKDIHHPNLWYYKLISFLGSKDTSRRSLDADPLQECDERSIECAEISEAEELEIVAPKRKVIKSSQSSGRKKRRPEAETINKVKTYIEPLRYPELTYQEVQQPILKTDSFYERKQKEQKAKTNTFGVYVGEQLEQISSFQRTVAEKLISEVLFLAKTGNLSCDSKIESLKQNTETPEYIMVSSPTMVEVDTENEKEQCETTLLKELLTEGRQN